MHEVLRISAGDLRKAITFLQSASDLYGRRVTPANVIEISGIFPDKLVGETIRCVKTAGYDGVRRQAQTVMLGGYNILGVLERVRSAEKLEPIAPCFANNTLHHTRSSVKPSLATQR